MECYGDNSYGQSENYTGGDAIGVSARGYHTCILKSDGNVDCYGYNFFGQSENYTGGDAFNPFRKYTNPEPIITTCSEQQKINHGELISISIAPANLQTWGRFYVNNTLPADTAITYNILNSTNDVVLCSGLMGGGDDISVCAASTQSIKLYANLTTLNASRTPQIHKWNVSWVVSISAATTVPKALVQFNTNNEFAVSLGHTNMILIIVKNPNATYAVLPLHIGSIDQSRNWMWFEGHKYDNERRDIEVVLKPHEEKIVVVKFLGGKTGRYAIAVGPDKEYKNRYDEIFINVVEKEKGFFFSSTPGLSWLHIVVLVLFGALFILKPQKTKHFL